MTAHIGIESRVDADWTIQPWRLVVLDDRYPGRRREWIGSLPDKVYVSTPRDPMRGNLLDLGPSLMDQAGDIAVHLVTECEHGIDIVASHASLPLIEELRQRGAVIESVPTETPNNDEMIDPYGIGGFAGHDIGTLAQMKRNAA